MKARAPTKKARPKAKRASEVQLLAGGNPRIAKADGDAPVRAYIEALSGWKRELALELDGLIVRHLPRVQKAVKWNSPLYGIEGRGWFLGLHTFTHYLKLAFFNGTALSPMPPGASKGKETRYLDIRENDALDKAQIANWLEQAAKLPGWLP